MFDTKLMRGSFAEILIGNERGLYGFVRRFGEQSIGVFINNSDKPQRVELKLGGYDLLHDQVIEAGATQLEAKAGIVVAPA